MSTPNLFRREAETFVAMMRELAPGLVLDFSPASIDALETWIHDGFDPPGSSHVGDMLVAGVGCYVGETVTRTLGGDWTAAGEVAGIGPIDAVFPLAKSLKRFRRGERDSLVSYYDMIAETAGVVPADLVVTSA